MHVLDRDQALIAGMCSIRLLVIVVLPEPVLPTIRMFRLLVTASSRDFTHLQFLAKLQQMVFKGLQGIGHHAHITEGPARLQVV